jgi:hypothetical protein
LPSPFATRHARKSTARWALIEYSKRMKSNHLWLLKAFVVGAVTVPILLWLAIYAISVSAASRRLLCGSCRIVVRCICGSCLCLQAAHLR